MLNMKEELLRQLRVNLSTQAKLNKQDVRIVLKLMGNNLPKTPATAGNPTNNASNNTTDVISREPQKAGTRKPKSKSLQRVKDMTYKSNAYNFLHKVGMGKPKAIKTRHNFSQHKSLHPKQHTRSSFQLNPMQNPFLHGSKHMSA